MRTGIVFTLTGTDRIGLVEDVTRIMLESGANVETSRAVRLGGEFAMLMLVSLPAGETSHLGAAFSGLAEEGYLIGTTPTIPTGAAPAGTPVYRITVQGADHEGIVHEIARGLSARGINIESMETSTSEAPVSGATLFAMTVLVSVPSELAEADWMAALALAGEQAGVDVEVTSST